MKFSHLIILILFTFSCKSSNNNLFVFDPRTLIENEIKLSDIADDIVYIPFDNSFPIGLIYSYKIIENSIFISAKDLGLIEFNWEGKFLKKIGAFGRGPGEYLICGSFAVDELTLKVYIKDRDETIKVYSKEGNFLRRITLPECKDGFPFSEVEIFNSDLFISQYINMGHAEYNWIIIDTIGNPISYKQNFIPIFQSREGAGGGTFKFENTISYWNWFDDTVYSVSPDMNYGAKLLFAPGEYRWPRLKQNFSSVSDYMSLISKYMTVETIFESKQYIVIKYYYINNMIAFIDKVSKKIFLTNLDSEKGNSKLSRGLINDLDGGPAFRPDNYFVKNDQEYMLEILNPADIKTIYTSENFQNNDPSFSDRNKKLKKVADNLKETDNPVLMIVRLKK